MRKRPVRHKVRKHTRKSRPVREYMRGHGKHQLTIKRRRIPFPSKKEQQEMKQFLSRTRMKLETFFRNKGIQVKIVPVGSGVRGTFISGESDVDIFVLSQDYEKAYELSKLLFPNGSAKLGELRIWHFVQDGYDVDLVFVDPKHVKVQTLIHTRIMRWTLTPQMKKEVIKAKAFFKTHGVYSAELGGITGIAIEELIRRHKTFNNICKLLTKERMFLQDPALTKPRNLLASVNPKRWRQIQTSCKEYLKTKRIDYRKFTIRSFIRKYPKHKKLIFHRRLDKAVDFNTAQSVADHSARALRNLEPDVTFDYDVFANSNQIVVVLNASPKTLTKTKTVKVSKRFPGAVAGFLRVHPEATVTKTHAVAKIPRKFTKPVEEYFTKVRKEMVRRGYKLS